MVRSPLNFVGPFEPIMAQMGNDKTSTRGKERCMAAKTSPAKGTATKAPKRKMTAIQKPMTKAAMVNEIAENTGLTKKDVSSVIEELGVLIERHVKKRSTGQFTLPGLLKIEVKQKKATKARKGVNPFTGEEMTIKAKPARRVVKIRPLKGLKEMLG